MTLFKNPIKLVTGSLSAGDVVQATPTPQRRNPSSVSDAVAGRRGVGVDRYSQDVDALIAKAFADDAALREAVPLVGCQVIGIEQLRIARARRLVHGGRRPTGGAA